MDIILYIYIIIYLLDIRIILICGSGEFSVIIFGSGAGTNGITN